MKKKRDETEVFSLAFLDVITCGFGAIILLLMIAKTGTGQVLETTLTSLPGVVRELQTQLFEIRGESRVLNRDLNAKHEPGRPPAGGTGEHAQTVRQCAKRHVGKHHYHR
jgi:hypothetical protein